MTQNTITVRSTRAAIRQAIASIPSAARQGGTAANAMMVRCGLAILGRIKQAFIVKSRGGTDDARDSWKPLSPRTIAYSTTRGRGVGGRSKAVRAREARPSQALNKKQQERWWEVYRRQLARYKGDKGHAAAAAWVVLKMEGAQTLVDKYGHRRVEILRDTDLLFNSLSPGTPTAESVFRVAQGSVTVGTNRKGAAAHHRGVPGRLPQRRLWPLVSRWPTTWWADIRDQVKQGLLEIATYIARNKS
jgi:hypothetical protein